MATKVDSTYLGYSSTHSTQHTCLVASGGRELATFRLLVRRFPATSHITHIDIMLIVYNIIIETAI